MFRVLARFNCARREISYLLAIDREHPKIDSALLFAKASPHFVFIRRESPFLSLIFVIYGRFVAQRVRN